jgi:hypothetical protein
MQVGDRALEILDRKCRRLQHFVDVQRYDAWLDELSPLLRWVMSVPVLNAYVKQIAAQQNPSAAESLRLVKAGLRRLPQLARRLRALRADIANDPADCPERLTWARFEDEIENARSSDDGRVERGKYAEAAGRILSFKAKSAWDALGLVDIDADNPPERLISSIYDADDALRYAVQSVQAESAVSARTALVRLVDVVRALHPPHDELPHWTDFLPREPLVASFAHARVKKDYVKYYERSRVDLARLVDELHVLGASTLSHRVVVERFKERCHWYDKTRMRDVARDQRRGRGSREDRLTLELAKYIHDSGLFVLVRPRVGNLEPDVVGLEGLAVEAKAYENSAKARADIIHGYYQLHSYMTALETSTMPVHEGFIVAFRLGGPIYDTPRRLDIGRFRIHSATIDLGESDKSGRRQPKTETITEQEILSALKPASTRRRRR